MRLKARLDYIDDVYVIAASFSSNRLKKAAPIVFIVDTGSSVTVINDEDAKRLDVNYNELNLSKIPYFGVGGLMEAYDLLECTILFREKESGKEYSQKLPRVVVNKHTPVSDKERRLMAGFKSLLGLDVLTKFNLSFQNFQLNLDIETS